MTPEQFDKATPQERNEAIALALGWKTADDANKLHPMLKGEGWWLDPNEPDLATCGLPDWQGDDGLAFKELFDGVICKDYSPAELRYRFSNAFLPKPFRKVEVGGFIYHADTWAHAICKSFLALKASKEVQ